MKFSIITVCFNAAGKIEKTIESVLHQTYGNVEYIIIDGASGDGTKEIIEEIIKEAGITLQSDALQSEISQLSLYSAGNITVKFISEPDGGLYDAMNKGIKMATGDYVEFLNAGDELYDENVLAKVAEHIKSAGPDTAETDKDPGSHPDSKPGSIYFGNIIYMNPDGTTDLRLYGKSCGKPIYFATGDCVNHQAIFAARRTLSASGEDACKSIYTAGKSIHTAGRSIHPENGEDYPSEEYPSEKYPQVFKGSEFPICADRDWMMRATGEGAKWIALNETVVKYELSQESISVRDKEKLRKEERLCLKKNYPGLVPIYCVFDFCRNNKVLAGILHGIYKKLYLRK